MTKAATFKPKTKTRSALVASALRHATLPAFTSGNNLALGIILEATVLLAAAPFASKADTVTSVNFGVWFVPTGDRGGSTIISLATALSSTDTEVTTSGAGSDRLTVIQGRDYTSSLAGDCNVKGSLAGNGAALTIGFEAGSNLNMSLEPAEHIFAQGFVAAQTLVSQSVSLCTPETSRSSVQVTNGEAVFRVVGDLTISNITR